ncbi:hypothetical protein GIB67_031045 [Kingdonia uniflora]|uniref:Uncharacterized protein n=1 Tax=Kingdonia uniflora TaxID=39325 RepID=A0A7J7NG93_9MAGN|nr:hypothetical protein GIB67_031045 [Kingdonia uniflora]
MPTELEESRKKKIVVVVQEIEMGCDRMEEVEIFDNSKIGVKDLVNSGITSIPKIFIYPSENLSDLKVAASCMEIPTIDLSNINSEDQRVNIVNQIKDASETWGFFQIINHVMPMQVMNETISAFKCCREQDDMVTYFNNQILSNAKAVNWKDSVIAYITPGSGLESYDGIPTGCRKELMLLDNYIVKLGDILMELMCEGLGVEPGKLKALTCLESHKMNEVSGLQVKHGQEWVEVKPKDGGIIVNVGDLLQIFSNDLYKSVEHRVMANSSRDPRVSIGVFFSPGKNGDKDYYGTLVELLTPEKPALYRTFNMGEVRKLVKASDSGTKELVDLFKL